jgi:hypothetical protein
VERFYDPENEWPCRSSGPSYDAAYRCVPALDSSEFWFSDPECERPFARTEGCAEPLVVAVREGGLDCAPISLQLFEVGERTRGSLHLEFGGACIASEGETDDPTLHDGYTVGDPIDIDSLPLLQPLLVGNGRLQAAYVGKDGVPLVRDWGRSPFTDTRTGLPCREVPFADGTVYCVPDSFAKVSDYGEYSGAGCAGDRLFYHRFRGCGVEFEGVIPNVQGCSTPYAEAFTIAPYAMGEAGTRLLSDDVCEPFTISPREPDYVITTGRIDLAEHFAVLDVVIVQ